MPNFSHLSAQVLAWQTAVAVGQGRGFPLVQTTATDVSGNVFVAGSFGGTMTLGATLTIGAEGSGPIFVAKLSDAGSLGRFIWAQGSGSMMGSAEPLAIAAARANVYVADYLFRLCNT